MANSISQFYVGDDSPQITYFPFVDTGPSPNASAGWGQFYSSSGAASSPGQVGVGDSMHFTYLNEASFMIKWNGTGIDLLGTTGNASYQVTLDGINTYPNSSNPDTTLASIHDLDNTNHTLLLTTFTNQTTPDSYVAFDKALITYAAPAGVVSSTVNSNTIKDNDDIAFMGQWSYVTDSAGNSMHTSNTAGDHVQATFVGSAITIYGLVSSYSGNYSVTIDNITASFSALSSYNDSNALLVFATDLSQDVPHTVILTNTQNKTFGIRVGGMNVTTFGNGTVVTTSSSSSSPCTPGTIAAIVLGAVLLVLLACILMYWLFIIRPRARLRKNQRSSPERVIDISPPPGEEEAEVASLSTTKGYGFGLGLQRNFPFFRKSKNGASSNGYGDAARTGSRSVSNSASPQWERDDKRLSTNTLTVEYTPFVFPPESEKLAPGWTNPITRTSFSSTGKGHTRVGSHRVALPELRVEEVGVEDVYDDDDADAKTLTSRQDETLAATLSLSPRTSEAPGHFVSELHSTTGLDGVVTGNVIEEYPPSPRDTWFLEVRESSPFRVDVGAILGQLKGNRDSRRTSGSGSSAWSRVRARLHRRTHRDDGKQSIQSDKPETPPETSGPESVPVVMLQSGSEPLPGETTPASTYSFLDFASSYSSLRRQSRTNTLGSAVAEMGHSGDRSPRSDNISMRMVRIEHNRPTEITRPGPDAPSTVSHGSQTESPSDKSNTQSSPSTAPATHTTHGSLFPFPITIPPSSHIPHSFNSQRQGETEGLQSFPPPPPVSQQAEIPPHSSLPPNSPTESVPFSVSDVHFRHSYSDYTDAGSRRVSGASALPPHPPLPSSQTDTSPPYIVQRVLGMTPATSHTPAARLAAGPATQVARPGTSPAGTPLRVHYRTGSVVGPRPRPSASGAFRGSSSLQLPLQGSWGRGLRTVNNKPPSSPRY